MFASIRTKLFILIVLANALMVGVLLSLNAASFNRSFSNYVEQQEARRLQPLLLNIALEYERQQHWRWLKWDNPEWLMIIQNSLSPREMRAIMDRNPKGGALQNSRRDFFDNFIIVDQLTNDVLLGRKKPPANLVWLPINTANGRTVAKFGFVPQERIDAQFDDVFATKQRRDIWFIGLFAVFIAGALAIPFSGWLVRPVRKITDAMRNMTQGDLSVSVSIPGRDELAQLAADFNLLASALRKNQTDRQQWVSDIAHELRTPVTIFQADIEAAQDGVRKVDALWLTNMHAQVERLTRLVNDLHQLSQSDAGTLSYRFEPINLTELTIRALTQFQQPCIEKCIDIRLPVDEQSYWIRGDEARLNQLFANLAQNTLRYTDGRQDHHGKLQVELVERGRHVELIWSDSSPGVGDHDLTKLFDRLYRVDESRSRDSGGSGLGLAIVKNIVEAHSGIIHAQHNGLGGLTIKVSLPRLES